MFADEIENSIGHEAHDADHDDRREHIVVNPVFCLLVDEIRNARTRADVFRDDQIRPRPTQQNAHVVVEIHADTGNDDAEQNLAAIGAEGLRSFD